MSDTDELYAAGAKLGAVVGDVLANVRRVAGNVREYVKGIEDAARVAATHDTKEGSDDGNRRDD